MIYHILNGDALAGSFPSGELPGEILVAREALVSGDLHGHDLETFWETRAGYLKISAEDYRKNSASQFQQMLATPNGCQFNLWFEYDLFCQVNMWFVLSLLSRLSHSNEIYVVYPSFLEKNDPQFWSGFGAAGPEELKHSFRHRLMLSREDIDLGSELWYAYKTANLVELKRLSRISPNTFPHLSEVVDAHIDRFPADGRRGRPEEFIRQAIARSPADFNTVFSEFRQKESIYGFGDTQVKELYEKVTNS